MATTRIPPPGWRVRWRRTVALTRDGLRRGWRPALFAALLGAAALGLIAPFRAFDRAAKTVPPGLSLASIPSAAGALSWTPAVRGPDALHQAALAELTELLVGAGIAAAAIALLAILVRAMAGAGLVAPDLAVHRAVGGSRRALTGWLAGEGLVIGVAALFMGLTAAAIGMRAGLEWWPGPPLQARPVWQGVALLVLTVIVVSALAPLAVVRDRHLADPPEGEVPLMLPAMQFAVSLAFVTAATLLIGERGADAPSPDVASGSAGLVVQLDSGVADPEGRSRQYGEVLRRLRAGDGQGRYSLTQVGAAQGLGTVDYLKTDCGRCVSGGIVVRWHTLFAEYQLTSPDSFEAGGARLLEGRLLEVTDAWDADRVAVVNRHLALRHFEGGHAVGRDLFLGTTWPDRPYRVVGIVEDERSDAFGAAMRPRETVYLSVLQHPPATADLVAYPRRGTVDRRAIANTVRLALGSGQVRPLGSEADYRAAERAPLHWFGGAFGVAAVVTLVAAVAGTVGMVALWVRAIATQLAIRRAVGCPRGRALAYVGVRAATIGAIGTLLGVVLYSGVLRAPLSLVAGDLPWWPPVLMIPVAAALTAIAAGAALVPAWRQLQRPPVTYL